MTAARQLVNAGNIALRDSAERALTKLARTFTGQMEALNHRRGKGQQKMTVEHVHVYEGVQAVVGDVHTGGGGIQKRGANLMNREFAFQMAPRCSATSKRTGKPCQAPAVRGWTVCRFHGARGGAPKAERNGAYRHGLYNQEAVEERRYVNDLLRQARDAL